ncbi:MAG: carotenoid oxygenase family protein [Oscillatoriaceae cyanobacterium]
MEKILSREPGWAGASAAPAKEFGPVSLKVISGAVPPGLRGTLYRNGPARLVRGGQRVGHWFDGDGAVLAVHLKPDAPDVTATYRYVQTAGALMEEKAGEFLLGGYGTMPVGSWWQRWGKGVKNAANTSVLALPDRLLALWEGGHPHALDLETLATWGTDDLGGLAARECYSAHPKRDPKTGEIYNFGIQPGLLNSQLVVYRSGANGKLKQRLAVPVAGVPLVHDFAIAGQYLVFFIPPVRVQMLPVVLKWKTYSDALVWQPNLGTQILMIDRDRLEVVAQGSAPPWYQWHFGNGAEDADGNLVLDLVLYQDFQTNQYLQEVATGKTTTAAVGKLWQVRLDPRRGELLERRELLDRPCEFPSVDPDVLGLGGRWTYLSLHRLGVDISREMFGAIGRFDSQTGVLQESDLGYRRYPTEPIYAPDADGERGWVLTVVYDANLHQSEVWIFNAEAIEGEPQCRLELPEVVPMGFHGTWRQRG